ncbi:unnamed protein product, partial [Brassica oleracea var. botrytis]
MSAGLIVQKLLRQPSNRPLKMNHPFYRDIAAADNAPTHPIVLPSTSQCSTMSSSILQTKLVTWPRSMLLFILGLMSHSAYTTTPTSVCI